MNYHKWQRWIMLACCGGVVLQATTCTSDALVSSALNIGLSALISMLFGMPIL